MVIHAPKTLHSEIKLPSSKSISNRALVICALSKSCMPLENISDCDDSRVVVEALQHKPYIIDIKAAGTAMRFLTSMLAATPGEHVITGTERMRNRPIGILVEALRSMGADISYEEKEGFPPLKIKGNRLIGGRLSLSGSISSQYISSLLMIGPMLQEGLTLELTGDIVSKPYIDMTLDIMCQFGASAQWISRNEISIDAKPYSPIPYCIEGDWSAASYWYEMVSLSEDENARVVLPNLFKGSIQGDAVVARLFEELGVGSIFEDNAVCLYKIKCADGPLVSDMAHCPDLAQTIAVTCCLLGKNFRLTGLQTLRIKETDRIAALQKELRKLGFVVGCEGDEVLFWNGEKETPKSGQTSVCIDTYEDHRMAMAFAPVTLKRNDITINNPEVVTKSYPGFWDDLTKAGFKLA